MRAGLNARQGAEQQDWPTLGQREKFMRKFFMALLCAVIFNLFGQPSALAQTETASTSVDAEGITDRIADRLSSWYADYKKDLADRERPNYRGKRPGICRKPGAKSKQGKLALDGINDSPSVKLWYVYAEPGCPPDPEALAKVAEIATRNCAYPGDEKPIVVCRAIADSGIDLVRGKDMSSPFNAYYQGLRIDACLGAFGYQTGGHPSVDVAAFESQMTVVTGQAGSERPRGVEVECARANEAERQRLENLGKITPVSRAITPGDLDQAVKDALAAQPERRLVAAPGITTIVQAGGSSVFDKVRFEFVLSTIINLAEKNIEGRCPIYGYAGGVVGAMAEMNLVDRLAYLAAGYSFGMTCSDGYRGATHVANLDLRWDPIMNKYGEDELLHFMFVVPKVQFQLNHGNFENSTDKYHLMVGVGARLEIGYFTAQVDGGVAAFGTTDDRWQGPRGLVNISFGLISRDFDDSREASYFAPDPPPGLARNKSSFP